MAEEGDTVKQIFVLVALAWMVATVAMAGERALGTLTVATSGSTNNRDTAVPFSIENGTLLSLVCTAPTRVGVGVSSCTSSTCPPLVTTAQRLYPTSCTYPLAAPYGGYSKCLVAVSALDGGATSCDVFQRYGNEGATRARGDSDTATASVNLTDFQGPVTFSYDAGDNGFDHYPVYITKGYDMSAGVQTLGICFSDNPPTRDGHACSSPSSRYGYLTLGSDGQMHILGPFTNDTVSTLNWSGNIVISVNGTGSFRLVGAATASLPACGPGGINFGAINYDTTLNKHVGCNGTAWQTLY